MHSQEGAEDAGKALGCARRAHATALGTIRSVEYAIQDPDEVAADLRQSITKAQKRITDLTAQIGQAFEYEDRFMALSRGRQEIADALDLTNQAGQMETGAPQEHSADEEDFDALKEESADEWLHRRDE